MDGSLDGVQDVQGEALRAGVVDDIGELAGRIRLGEDSTLELKRIVLSGDRVRSPDRHDLADELAAMANTHGGTVVLGVDDRTREILGIPLDDQVTEALHFVRRNMLVRATKELARSERPQFSERAVFEALVNAVAHRDYSMAGARIRLHLFGDRLELYVPGALANTLTPDSLHLRQSSRNELIVSLLARCPAPTGLGRSHMMDRRGDGVPVIRDECERISGHLPEYSLLDDSELRLVMRAAE